MWLVYSKNKFFRVGPNISEKFVPGGTNFRGVQLNMTLPDYKASDYLPYHAHLHSLLASSYSSRQ